METTPGVEVARAVTLNVLAALQLSSHYIQESTLESGSIAYDYVVVGGGTAGCIMANRLSENPDISVALLEAGSQQPYESVFPAYYPLLPGTNYDYNFYTEEDDYSAQAIRGKSARIPAGKMLGGTSGIHNMFHIRSNRRDFESWVEASGDPSWSYDEMLKYYIKSETLEDEEILNSPDAAVHGTEGPVHISKQHFPANDDIIKSFEELGYKYQLDLNGANTQGVAEPALRISNGKRQSMSEAYLLPAKDRPNLSIFTLTTATKVLFDDGNNAVGVEAINSKNETVIINANKEVIITAGVMRSSQLLFLSGIGPREYIESWGLDVVSELPVGLALRDHVGSVMAYKLKESNRPSPAFNRTKFPIAVTVSLKSLNSSNDYPDFQAVNMFFPKNSPMLDPVVRNDFKFIDDVCDRFIAANQEGDLFLSFVQYLYSESTGKTYLRDVNPLSDPWIYMGTFIDPQDLENLAAYVQDFSAIADTEYFKNSGAEFVELDLEFCNWRVRNTWDYWRCYARSTSTLFRHHIGSVPMGPVLDSELNVHGVQRLRVVGAAAIPRLTSGHVITDEIVLSEKAADIVKAAQLKEKPSL